MNFKGFLTVLPRNYLTFAVIFVQNLSKLLKQASIIFITIAMTVAILAPPVLTWLNMDTNNIVLVELTEEEPQQKSKKQLEENKIVQRLPSYMSLAASQKRTKSYIYYKEDTSTYFSEIYLPPPETHS
ncbi:MAG: hypothetical protein CL605_13255 [Altibacter sp.]|nr:hypothetical protein [Altibacter sp.]|tara:strand:+ start:289 stop:672 length:384 start_codon:yes stop_codon:yes gene_type:complete